MCRPSSFLWRSPSLLPLFIAALLGLLAGYGESYDESEEEADRGRAVERRAPPFVNPAVQAAVVKNALEKVGIKYTEDTKFPKGSADTPKGSRSPVPHGWTPTVWVSKFKPRLAVPDSSFSACSVAQERARRYAPPVDHDESGVLEENNEAGILKKKSKK